jgi:hypothetical protein
MRWVTRSLYTTVEGSSQESIGLVLEDQADEDGSEVAALER